MIAGSEHLAAHIEKLLGNCRRESKAAGCIFRIGDDQINGMGFHHVGEVIAHDVPPGTAENISYEENLHNIKSTISLRCERGGSQKLIVCYRGELQVLHPARMDQDIVQIP
jgi:hypothetical protein